MIALDTNVVVRFLAGDDPEQFAKAKRIFERENIVLTTTVILETEWVLRYAYGFKSLDITEAFERLFGLPQVLVESQETVHQALTWHRKGLDFADALHLAQSSSCDAFVTFDKKLIKNATKITSVPVKEP